MVRILNLGLYSCLKAIVRPGWYNYRFKDYTNFHDNHLFDLCAMSKVLYQHKLDHKHLLICVQKQER
jgi:hypothetical protein